MNINRSFRVIAKLLMCLIFSAFFAVLGFGTAMLIRTMCLEAGYRWSILAEDSGILMMVAVGVLAGAVLGAIVGKKCCFPGHKVSQIEKTGFKHQKQDGT